MAHKRLALPLLLSLTLICLTLPALAAEDPPTVTAQVVHSQTAYTPGASHPLVLRFHIRPGFHINTHKPSEPDIYPTNLSWEQNPSLTFAPAIFPSPRSYKPSFSDKPMEVHDGVLDLRLSFTVAATAAPGPQAVKAKLEYQACDDQSCLMPETLEVPVTITVAAKGKPGKPLNSEVFGQTGQSKGKKAGGQR
ncbi:MAG: hypothetical protein HY794_11775 [Desulfarculus sp.]|nr:hypothetical protein [Desulfarculus sp.]